MASPFKHRIRTTAAAIGVAAGLTLIGLPAAQGSDGGSEMAACDFEARKPYTAQSENTGYAKAKLHVPNSCSANSEWVGRLRVYEWGDWVTRDKLDWRGTTDQKLKYDCEDGTTTAYKAVLKNTRNGAKDVSPTVDLTCPTP